MRDKISLVAVYMFIFVFYVTCFMPTFMSIAKLSIFLSMGLVIMMLFLIDYYRLNLIWLFSFEIMCILVFLFYNLSVGYLVTIHSKEVFIADRIECQSDHAI